MLETDNLNLGEGRKTQVVQASGRRHWWLMRVPSVMETLQLFTTVVESTPRTDFTFSLWEVLYWHL